MQDHFEKYRKLQKTLHVLMKFLQGEYGKPKKSEKKASRILIISIDL